MNSAYTHQTSASGKKTKRGSDRFARAGLAATLAESVDAVDEITCHLLVVVLDEDEVARQLRLHPGVQRGQPAHLVGELVAARGLAVGEVAADHAQCTDAAGDHARLLVGEAGDVAHHVGRFAAREQRQTRELTTQTGLLRDVKRAIAWLNCSPRGER